MKPRNRHELFCDSLAPADRISLFDRDLIYPDEKKLEKNMEIFYRETKLAPSKKISEFKNILDDNFIVGETHSHISPKKFIIDHMTELKASGFEILFMEHLVYDDQQLLDDFFKTGFMDEKLEKRLNELDMRFGRPHQWSEKEEDSELWEKNNLFSVVVAARAEGIRIVALDTHTTYTAQYDAKHMESYGGDPTGKTLDDFRIKSMNYTACKIIEKEMAEHQCKWFALMGSAHVKRHRDIPGVADLTGARSIYAFDTPTESQSIKLNSTHQYGRDTVEGDVIICSPPADPVPSFKMIKPTHFAKKESYFKKEGLLFSHVEERKDLTPTSNTSNISNNDNLEGKFKKS